MASVPKVARKHISLARCIHCCPNFSISFSRPASLYCDNNVGKCIYIYIYVSGSVETVFELPLLQNNAATETF